MPICSLCSAFVEDLEGIVPGELDLNLALHRLTECPGIDMTTQRNFLFSPAKIAELSGGFGASKTVTACVWQILLAGQRIPGSEHLCGRLNKPALDMTTRATYLSLSPRIWVDDWIETKGKLVWKNGATTWFKHLDIADADVAGHIRSMNLTSFLVDQAEEISESTFLTLIGRLRRHTEPLAHFGRMVINPAGQDWNWRRFFDPKRSEKWQKNLGFSVDTRQNAKNLPEDYIQNMLDNYPEDWQARFIRGEFTEFSDLIYKEFSPGVHGYDSREWLPPLEWSVIVGLDFGGVDPWGVVFIAIEPKSGSLFVFDEIYQSGILVREIAERYQEIMKGRTLEGMAYDYENQQAALELGECGVDGSPANKDVKAGIFKVAQYLHVSPAASNYFTGQTPGPRLYVASHCENTIRELGSYKWGKDRKGEVTGKPQDGNDHTCDALRYAIHTFRPEPASPEIPKNYENSKINPASRLYWHRKAINDEKVEREKAQLVFRSPFSRRKSMIQPFLR
jgi:hypothetical protein